MKENCQPELAAYEKCVRRIQGKPGKNCLGWYFDIWECTSVNAAPKIFATLKYKESDVKIINVG